MKLIERFVYRELADGDEPRARQIQRLVVGLRRKLENFDVEATPPGPPSAPKGD